MEAGAEVEVGDETEAITETRAEAEYNSITETIR